MSPRPIPQLSKHFQWSSDILVDVVLCSWRTAVYESYWESAARRFWCWRGTTRLTARLCRRCSPAQMSVWGRAKGRQRLRVYKPSFRAALHIPQSSITGSWWPHRLSLRNLDVHQRLTAVICRKSLWESVKHWDSITFPSLHHHGFSLEKSNDQINWFSPVKTIICGMTHRQIVNDYFTWARDFVKGMSQCAILMKNLVSFFLLCL